MGFLFGLHPHTRVFGCKTEKMLPPRDIASKQKPDTQSLTYVCSVVEKKKDKNCETWTITYSHEAALMFMKIEPRGAAWTHISM